jgi:glycosyltransferase involved in cell wall biosynthesis
MATDPRSSYAPRSAVLIAPGDLQSRSGGYEYDRRIIAGLRNRGWSIGIRRVDGAFPLPSAAAREAASQVLASIPDGSTVIVDGLALGAMPDEIGRASERLRIVALVHLPLAEERGIDRDTATRLAESERRALSFAALVVVTGQSTADTVTAYGVTRDRIALVEPGTDLAPLARGSSGSPLQLLTAAAVIPRKGHDILFRALATVPHRDWHLTCAGSLERSRQTVTDLRNQLRALNLDSHVSFVGELDASAMEAAYSRADLFVLATLHETYCMAVAEAIAHGLPVVGTSTGAIPSLLSPGKDAESRAGLVAPPGDVEAFASALAEVLSDSQLRARLAAGARGMRERLPSWDDAAERMAAALDRVSERHDG